MRIEEEKIQRVEDAPLGLAYVLRKHDSLFYVERGSKYLIDVPRRTKAGKPDHRNYERWVISKDKVELTTKDLECQIPPLRFDAEPLRTKKPRPRKRSRKRL
jgi:hypothetical protein